jgi:hypothetical protein
MAHQIVLSPQAERDLASFSAPIRDYVVTSMTRLAENPVTLSRASHFPYPPECQLFRPEPLFDETDRHEFMILFRYRQDEVSLQIIGIGHYILE